MDQELLRLGLAGLATANHEDNDKMLATVDAVIAQFPEADVKSLADGVSRPAAISACGQQYCHFG